MHRSTVDMPWLTAACAATHHLTSPAARSGLPSGLERRALAAWVPKRACVGALVPGQSHHHYTTFGHPGIDLTAWTEDLMDTDRRPKGAAANSSSVSAYAQTRCYRSHPKGVYPVPHRLRVF